MMREPLNKFNCWLFCTLFTLPLQGMEKPPHENEPSSKKSRTETLLSSPRVEITGRVIPELLENIKEPAQNNQIGTGTLISADEQAKEVTVPFAVLELSNSFKNMLSEITTDRTKPVPLLLTDIAFDRFVGCLQAILNLPTAPNYSSLLIETLKPQVTGLSCEDLINILQEANRLDVPILFEYLIALIAYEIQASGNLDAINSLVNAVYSLPADLRKLIEVKKDQSKHLLDHFVTKVINIPYINVEFDSSRNRAFAASEGIGSIIDLKTGNEVKRLRDNYKFDISAISGDLILTRSGDQAVILNLADCKPLQTFNVPGRISALAFTKNRALTSTINGTTYIWDISTGNLIKSLKEKKDIIQAVITNPTETVAITSSSSRTLTIWDLSKEVEPFEQKTISLDGNNNFVTALAFNPKDDTQFLAGSWNGTATLWDRKTCKPIQTFNHGFNHDKSILTVAISPSGHYALTGSFYGVVSLWNINSGRLLKTLSIPITAVTKVGFSADESTIFVATPDKIILW